MVKLDELGKLSPEERIKKLHELQEQSREEIETAQKLIKESEMQLEEEKKIEEMIRDVPLPQQKKIEVSDLWKEESLEEQVSREKVKLTKEQRQYGIQLAETKAIEDITQNVYHMEQSIAEKGYMNPHEEEQFHSNLYALKKKEEKYRKAGLDYEAKKAMRAEEEAERFLNTYIA